MKGLDARTESLIVPASVRAQVDTRDGLHCRVCGKYLGERRALHHIRYGGDLRGLGGRRQHRAEEIVTVCWLPGDNDCHQLVHSNKALWTDLLLEVVRRPGLTALQLKRWGRTDPRHDYEPGEGRHPMHTDPLCVCGRPAARH